MQKNIIFIEKSQFNEESQAQIIHRANISYIPRVSVVIPIYNVEQYLKETLYYITNQTLKDIEIICVDDGSTDSSLDITKEYAQKDSRITIITQKNLYGGVARNTGLSIARGETIIWIDADDMYRLELLEKLYNKLMQTKADIVLCPFNRISPKEEFVGTDDKLDESLNIFSKDTVSDILTLFSVPPYNKLYNLNFVKKNNLNYSATKIQNDLAFSIKSRLLADKIAVVHEILIVHRNFSNTSVTRERGKHVAIIPFVTDDVFEFLIKNNFFNKDPIFFTHYILKSYGYNLNFPISDEVMEEFRKNLLSSKFFNKMKTTPFYKHILLMINQNRKMSKEFYEKNSD